MADNRLDYPTAKSIVFATLTTTVVVGDGLLARIGGRPREER